MKAAEPAAVGADPQDALAIDEQGRNAIDAELRRVGFVENGEPDAVEARQTLFGRDPQIAIGRLGDGEDGGLGQAGVGRPDFLRVLS